MSQHASPCDSADPKYKYTSTSADSPSRILESYSQVYSEISRLESLINAHEKLLDNELATERLRGFLRGQIRKRGFHRSGKERRTWLTRWENRLNEKRLKVAQEKMQEVQRRMMRYMATLAIGRPFPMEIEDIVMGYVTYSRGQDALEKQACYLASQVNHDDPLIGYDQACVQWTGYHQANAQLNGSLM